MFLIHIVALFCIAAAHSTVPANNALLKPLSSLPFSVTVVLSQDPNANKISGLVYQPENADDLWSFNVTSTVTVSGTTVFSGTTQVPGLLGQYNLIFKVTHTNSPPSADFYITISSVEISCSDGNLCNGQERFVEGKCVAAPRALCDDNDPCSIDTCNNGFCVRSRNPSMTAAQCPDCTGSGCNPSCGTKVCGGDGCGGTCGTCSAGLNCVNGACSTQQFPGTCTTANELTSKAQAINFAGQIIVNGDNSVGINQISPFCNQQSQAAEEVWKLTNTNGDFVGIEVRMLSATGDPEALDTVLQLIEVNPALYPNPDFGCLAANGNAQMMVTCADDSSPPGGLSSRVTYSLKVGYVYYIVADGYSASTVGPYQLIITLTPACTMKCDGKYCGDSGCTSINGTCGVCPTGQVCATTGKCVPYPCVPSCKKGAQCGDDGCGGSCGTCKSGYACYTDIRKCRHIEQCNHFRPICRSGINGDIGCPAQQFCGSDCQCRKLSDPLMDLVLRTEDMQPTIVNNYEITPTSCALAENCVNAPGFRRVVKFATNVANQGTAPFTPPNPPASFPDLFTWGSCHGHWHFQGFAHFQLIDLAQNVLVTGRKQSYCAEDSYRLTAPGSTYSGTNVPCDAQTACDQQGLSVGWTDVYGPDLDCQFLDITGVPAGEYKIRMCTNIGRTFEELSFENNCGDVPLTIPPP